MSQFFAALTLFIGAYFFGLASADAGEKTKDIGAVVKRYADQGFWGVVRASQGGQVLYEGTVGKRRVGEEAPIQASDRFLIGSVTKQFTAAAILQLEEQGKLSLSDLVSKHLPDAPHGGEITIEQMLHHVSGLANYTALPEFWTRLYDKPASVEALLGLIAGRALQFTPGTQWSYCNTGYLLAGAIVEKLSGQQLGDYFQSHFFLPLQMNSTSYGLKHELAKLVSGHVLSEDYSQRFNPISGDLSWARSAGAVASTAEDLARWNRGLEYGGVLSPRALKKMRTAGLNYYGLGVGVVDVGPAKWISHSGGLPGFQSFLAFKTPTHNPEISLSIVSNFVTPNFALLVQDLSQLLLRGEVPLRDFPTPVETSLEERSRVVGTYQIDAIREVGVFEEHDSLYLQVTGQPRWKMLARSSSRFYLGPLGVDVEALLPEAGARATALLIFQDGKITRANRVR